MHTIQRITEAYIALGWQPVPVVPTGKATYEPDWTRKTYTPADFSPGDNIGIKLGSASGGLVDIDCDCPEAIALAPHFLPETWCFGRPGETKIEPAIAGLRSGFAKHYLYRVVDAPATRTKKPTGIHLEWRAERAQTVFPGSIHTSGVAIEWCLPPGADTTAPAEVTEDELRRAFTALAISVSLARLWPTLSGGRHHAVMSVAGGLWHAGWPYEVASAVILRAAELAGADDTHERVIIDTWDDTHERNRYGWTTAEDVLGPIATTLRRMVSDCGDKIDKVESVDAYALNESGNADRLLDRFGDDLRYVQSIGWYRWDGKIWAPDAIGPISEIEEVARTIIDSAAGLPSEQAAQIVSWGQRSGNASTIRGTVFIASSRPQIAVDVGAFDADPWLLNTPGGTVDMRTATLRPARREDLCTQQTAVAPDFDAPCPTFAKFLTECMAGDTELVQYLLIWMGYCLSGDVSAHTFHIWHGAGGNGKSTLLNVLRHIWGDYAGTVDPNVLLASRSDQHPTGLMDFRGKRLMLTSEPPEGRRWNEAIVKRLTGGDSMKARSMHKDFVEFDPTWKIVMATNTRPLVREVSGALWRRVHLVPWSVSFRGREDVGMERRLIAEAPAILGLLVKAAAHAAVHGIGTASRVRKEVEDYRRSQDVLGTFFDEALEKDPKATVGLIEAYGAYTFWAEMAREYILPRLAFRRIVEERGCRIVGDRLIGYRKK